MIVTKKALPRRTFLRGLGATLALPLAGRHGSGYGRDCVWSRSPRCAWRSFTFPTGSSKRIGFLQPRALGSILLPP